nr:hypothetical protein [Tanacetum cinerariifolium]
MGRSRGRAYVIDGGIWYSVVSSKMNQLHSFMCAQVVGMVVTVVVTKWESGGWEMERSDDYWWCYRWRRRVRVAAVGVDEKGKWRRKSILEVVNDEDDDVFTEATPLARKVPIVDYQIVLINNKPRFKIIKADETHQLYISFITLLKNFDREDLEDLWGIVKGRFSTSKPSNFSDEYLLTNLKTMFEKPDGQDAVWKSQRSVHGQALKISTFKVYTGQLVNVTRLQEEEESEMSLELLRFIRQQLQEYQQG